MRAGVWALWLAVTMAIATGARADASWMLGVKAGPSIATIGGDDAGDEADSRVSFAAGMFAQADLSPHFALRFEGLVVGKGAAAEENDLESALNLDYLEFPILLVAQTPVSEAVTLSAFAGPAIGFNIGAEAELEFGELEFDTDIEDDVAGFEFGVAFGVGAAFKAGSVVIVLDARYDLGLTSIDDGLSATDEDLDLQNQAWIVMAGVGFPLGAR